MDLEQTAATVALLDGHFERFSSYRRSQNGYFKVDLDGLNTVFYGVKSRNCWAIWRSVSGESEPLLRFIHTLTQTVCARVLNT